MAKSGNELVERCVLVCSMLFLLAAPFIARSCRKDAGPAPNEPVVRVDLPVRKLVALSPHWEGIRVEFANAFSRWTEEKFGHRTEVEWLDLGGTSDIQRFIRSEYTRSPEGIDVDIFFGGGIEPYIMLAESDLLERCDLPALILTNIPPVFAGVQVYDPAERWFGACLSGFGVVYNKVVLDRLGLPVPKSWADLGRPEYFSWVGSGDPRSSGSVHMVYEIILQAYGWDEGWGVIVRMGGNTRNFARSGGQPPQDTAMGEVACATAIDVYAWQRIAEAGTNRMGFVLPDGLTIVNPDGIAVLKGAPHRKLAEQFVEFVLSEQGQKLWCLKKGAPGGPVEYELDRMPVIPGFAARFGDLSAVSFDPFAWKGGFKYDAEKGTARITILNDLIGCCIIEAHEELVDAWRVLRDRPSDAQARRMLCAPPLGEDELLSMASEEWGDAEIRTRMMSKWVSDARQRYRAASALQ